jgi:hypothetical protein
MNFNLNYLISKSAIAIVAAAFVLGQAQAAVITLSPSTGTPGAGGSFSVDVLVTGVFDAPHAADELFEFGFDVGSSGAGSISFLGFTPGPLFDPLLLPGTDVAGISQAPSITPPAVEPLLLATLNFLAGSPGTVVISISADPVGNLNEGLLYLSGSDDIEAQTTINVGPAGVPEPSSMLLAGVGLALAAARFYKP